MTKRRVIVKVLTDHGYVQVLSGTTADHDKYRLGGISIPIERHREISNLMAQHIQRGWHTSRGLEVLMLFIADFEILEHEGMYLAFPHGLHGGGTEGHDFSDAVRMAADWLYVMALDYLMKGEEFPEYRFTNEPEHGGKIVTVAVSASLDQVPAMTAAEAARTLGISAARVAQLCKAGYLESWKVGGTRMVSRDSVEARAQEPATAGRPRKDAIVA